VIIELTSDRVGAVRDWACFSVGAQSLVDGAAVRDALAARLRDRHYACRAQAVLGLARRRDERAITPCLEALGRHSVGQLYVEAAAYLASPRLQPVLEDLRAVGWNWSPELLDAALERCDPDRRAAADGDRRATFAKFEKRIRRIRSEYLDLRVVLAVLHSLQAAQGCSGALLSFGCDLVNEVHIVGDRLEVPVDEGRPKASISSKPHIDSVT